LVVLKKEKRLKMMKEELWMGNRDGMGKGK
jgi:hypothetical protein